MSKVQWDQVCSNSALFNQIFATDILGKEKAEFQETVCNRAILQGDFRKLFFELNKNVDGFTKLYSSVSYIFIYIFFDTKF